MKIQFETVSFDSELYAHSVVSGNTLTIVTEKSEIDVVYPTAAEAKAGQVKLNAQLNKADVVSSVHEVVKDVTDSVSGLISGFGITKLFGSTKKPKTDTTTKEKVQSELDNIFSGVGSIFGSTKDKVQEKASDAKLDINLAFGELINQLITSLEEQEQEEQKKQPATKPQAPKAKSALDEAEAVFGTTRRESNDPADELISTFTDVELRTAITAKADELISNNEKVKQLLVVIRRDYTEDVVQQIIEEHKRMIFRAARDNPTLTLNEVFNYFLG